MMGPSPAVSKGRHGGPGAGSIRTRARMAILCAGSALLAQAVRADVMETGARETEARIKVAFVYNFPKFIDWPDEPRATEAPIRICVLGTDPMGTLLGDLSLRTVRDRLIEVATITDRTPLSSCQMLYIGRSEEQQLPVVLQQARGTPVLTVSDIPLFAHLGGMIGFVIEQDRVRIEINPGALLQAGLKARAKLLEIARIVQ